MGGCNLWSRAPRQKSTCLLTQVRLEMGRYIAAVEEQTRPAMGQFKTFEVRF